MVIKISGQRSAYGIVDELASADQALATAKHDDSIVVKVGGFLRVTPIALIASWLREKVHSGYSVRVDSPDRAALNYWERIGALDYAADSYRPTIRRNPEGGRFVPLHDVSQEPQQGRFNDAVQDFLMHSIPPDGSFLESVEWVLGELLANVEEHSKDPGCALGIAQKYESELEIAVVDRGIGLAAALHQRHPVSSDVEAVKSAVIQGVSGESDGRGNGLTGISQIAELNEGLFVLGSQTAMRFQGTYGTRVRSTPRYAGTFVSAVLQTEKHIDLSKTLLGVQTWTYLDRLWTEAAEGQLTVDVSYHLESVTSRSAAARLGSYIAHLAQPGQGDIILDFTKCRNPTSAFAGQLLTTLHELLSEDWLAVIAFKGLSHMGLRILAVASGPYGKVRAFSDSSPNSS